MSHHRNCTCTQKKNKIWQCVYEDLFNRSCGGKKALSGVDKVQVTVMHYCSTCPICQFLKNNIKVYLSYNSLKTYWEKFKNQPIYLHILNILHCCLIDRENWLKLLRKTNNKVANNWKNSNPVAEHFHWFDTEKVSIQDIKITTEAIRSRMLQNNLKERPVPVSSNSDKGFTQICILLICNNMCWW